MKKIIFYLFTFTLLISSCKKSKDLPEAEVNQPEFYINCNINGQPLKLEAGNNDYYMNSSCFQDSGNVYTYVYKGHMKKKNGQDYEITILFNNAGLKTSNGAANVDSTLTIGEHLYNDKIIDGLTQNITFKPVKYLENSANYSWAITDGVNNQNYSGSGPDLYSISPSFDVGKTYSVTLHYKDGTGNCDIAHENVFKVGNKLQTTVTAERVQLSPELKYKFTYTKPSYAGGSFACKWNFDADNSSSTTPEVTKTFQEGTSKVRLALYDKASGDSCISYYQLNSTVRPAGCDANYVAEFAPIHNTKVYSSVVVLLTDQNGVVYSSQNFLQPLASKFELQEVSDYKLNENSQPTKRLKIKFNCIVNSGNSQINITDGDAVIAVSYK